MGRVDFGGVSRSVCLEHVDVTPGDWVLVHVGFALTRLSPDEAAQLLRLLDELALAEAVPEPDEPEAAAEGGVPRPETR